MEKDPFDINGNGTLEPNEQRVRLMHRADAFYRKYDTNKDGEISPSENEVHHQAVLQTVSMDEQSLREERGKSGSILPAEMDKYFPVKTAGRTGLDRLWDIQIRRSIDDVEPFWAHLEDSEYDKELKKVKAATFSYARDLTANADIWVMRGVIARPILFSDEEVFALVPSISFDRVDNGVDSKKDVDSLIFRLTGEYVSTLSATASDSVTAFVRGKATYGTTFGFDENKLWAGEFEFELVPSALGFRTFKNRIPGLLRVRPRAFLHSEFGSAQSDRDMLTEDQKDFFRVGPVISLEIVPDIKGENWASLNERLMVTLKYNYYWSTKGDTDFKNFTARLDWALDEKGHFKAAVEYQNGSLELATQSVRTFTVGLGVAF
jgi:hypothetical protein